MLVYQEMYIGLYLLTFVILYSFWNDVEARDRNRTPVKGSHDKLSSGNVVGSQENTSHSKGDPLHKALEIKNNRADPFKKWKMGTVPYLIDHHSYDEIITRRIQLSIKSIERASCVVFKNVKTKDSGKTKHGTDWLHITNPRNEKECVHSTRVGDAGETVLTLGFECIQKSDITHALLHVLGFKDEVTHPQRDSFVRVLWENIQPKYHHLFTIQNEPTPYQTLVEYDTTSIMHFHDRAFSSNGGATISPMISGLIINPSDRLSQLDKMKLRLTFGHECNKRKVDNLFETCKSCLVDHEADGTDYGSDGLVDPKKIGNSTETKTDEDKGDDFGEEEEEIESSEFYHMALTLGSRNLSRFDPGSVFGRPGTHRHRARN